MSAELDLSTREVLHQKASFYHQVRKFFLERNVLEVITSPFLNNPPTDLHLDHFVCQAYADPEVFYMHSSPEYPMKSLIMQGSGDIFQICQVARGNEYGSWHSKTFNMLEWYRQGLSLNELQLEVCELMSILLNKQLKPIIKSYQQSYAQHLNINNIHALSLQDLQEYFCENQLQFSQEWLKDDFLHYMMTHLIEPKFQSIPLAIIYDYPASQAALAKCYQDNNGNQIADRFEVYCFGIEIGNAYNELTDPIEHQQRFDADQLLRAENKKPCYPMNKNFISELKTQGMPETAGIAMGLDRMFALSLGAKGLILL